MDVIPGVQPVAVPAAGRVTGFHNDNVTLDETLGSWALVQSIYSDTETFVTWSDAAKQLTLHERGFYIVSLTVQSVYNGVAFAADESWDFFVNGQYGWAWDGSGFSIFDLAQRGSAAIPVIVTDANLPLGIGFGNSAPAGGNRPFRITIGAAWVPVGG